MAARFIVSNYQNRKGNARTSVLMTREDALLIAVGDTAALTALSEAVAKAEEEPEESDAE